MVIINTIDIEIAHQHVLINLLKTYLPDTTVWAYGSRTNGTSHSGSDLDIVAFIQKKQRSQVSLLKEAFEESNLPFRVDLFIWDEIPKSFQKNILQKHIILIEKP